MSSSGQSVASPTMKDGSSGNRKGAAVEEAVKCPRCDSPNTKFCYYNNYSLTQPRHFCKTCRRYWTKGGALRNVPIGGGCRKNKKAKSDVKFFTGGLSPAIDLGLSSSSSFPRLNQQYSSTGHYNMTAQFSGTGGYGLQSCLTDVPPALGGGAMNNSSGLASSIESLSCINQDLHWKLQQQRLAMLFGNANNFNGGGTDNNNNSSVEGLDQQKRNLMIFQNLDEVCGSSRKEAGADVATEWFFGNHTTVNNGGDRGMMRTAGNWNTGVRQGWSPDHRVQQHNQYTALP